MFWLCTGLSKHSSICLAAATCLGIGAVPTHSDDVPATPPGTGRLLFPLAQAGAPFFFFLFFLCGAHLFPYRFRHQ